MPLYVAVEFKGYSGPVWDNKNNPKVRITIQKFDIMSVSCMLCFENVKLCS